MTITASVAAGSVTEGWRGIRLVRGPIAGTSRLASGRATTRKAFGRQRVERSREFEAGWSESRLPYGLATIPPMLF
jgi:hypothetical protein